MRYMTAKAKLSSFPKLTIVLKRTCNKMLDHRLMFLIHLSTRFSLVWWKSYNWSWACIDNTMPMKRGFLNQYELPRWSDGDKWNHAQFLMLNIIRPGLPGLPGACRPDEDVDGVDDVISLWEKRLNTILLVQQQGLSLCRTKSSFDPIGIADWEVRVPLL